MLSQVFVCYKAGSLCCQVFNLEMAAFSRREKEVRRGMPSSTTTTTNVASTATTSSTSTTAVGASTATGTVTSTSATTLTTTAITTSAVAAAAAAAALDSTADEVNSQAQITASGAHIVFVCLLTLIQL